jgi:hypothetical protein
MDRSFPYDTQLSSDMRGNTLAASRARRLKCPAGTPANCEREQRGTEI